MWRSPLLTRIAQVQRLAAPPRWAGPAIIALGLLAAALEGAGLYLFIPLVQSLGAAGSTDQPILRVFERLLQPVPRDLWTPVLVIGLCLSILAKNLVQLVGHAVTRLVDGLVAHRLRLRVFEQTIASCVDYRVSNRMTDIVTTLTGNTWQVSRALSMVYRLAVCAAAFAVFLTLLLIISVPLTALAMLMMSVAALVVHLVTRRATDSGHAVVEENKRFGLRMWESVGALQLIRSFAREDYEIDRFRQASNRVRRRMLHLDLLWAAPTPISETFGAVLIGALILAGVGVGAGLASLAAFLAVLYRLQGPVRDFLSCKVALEGMGGAISDVDQFLSETAQPYLRSGPRPAAPIRSGLEFQEVSFRYEEADALALDRVSFTLPAGKTTAIVGRSGAGKSTLMSLIFRFQDPSAGRILVDGAPLDELDLQGWRRRLSLMAQEAQLFNDTIETNIGYGDLDAGPEQIRAAAEVAGADGFIRELPQGYATELGDRGMRLSGGQRQRIALARAILKDPDLLLLDEPTSAVDSETEQAFQAALKTFSAGRTVVVIAHRLSTVRTADQVVVLEGGRVVEVGAPADLLSRPGHFARMYGLQTAADQREVA